MNNKKNIRPLGFLRDLLAGGYGLVVLFPVFWVFYTSFKTNKEFVANPWALPQKWQLENYSNAWVKIDFQTYALNSILVTICSVAVVVVLSSTVAYILVRSEKKWSEAVLMLFIAGLYVPTALILPSEFTVMYKLNLWNTHLGLGLLYVVFSLPYSILVMSGFYRSMPKELEEAAAIDGCGVHATFWKIIFPLSKNGLITIIIFNFVWIWNDYIFALTFIHDKELLTLPVGIIALMESFKLKADWVTLFSGLNIVMIPSIVLYICFQKYLTKGLTTGSVKG